MKNIISLDFRYKIDLNSCLYTIPVLHLVLQSCDLKEKMSSTSTWNLRYLNVKEYLKPNIKVEKAYGSFVSKFILFLHPSHLHDTQTLWLGW